MVQEWGLRGPREGRQQGVPPGSAQFWGLGEESVERRQHVCYRVVDETEGSDLEEGAEGEVKILSQTSCFLGLSLPLLLKCLRPHFTLVTSKYYYHTSLGIMSLTYNTWRAHQKHRFSFRAIGSDVHGSWGSQAQEGRPSVCGLNSCSTHLSHALQNEKYSTRKHLKVPENVTKLGGLCKNGVTPSRLAARILAKQNVWDPCACRAHMQCRKRI